MGGENGHLEIRIPLKSVTAVRRRISRVVGNAMSLRHAGSWTS